MAFALDYSHEALRHLRSFSVADQRRITSAIHEQLKHQPDVKTRHRKPLQDDTEGRWELRIGDLSCVLSSFGRRADGRGDRYRKEVAQSPDDRRRGG